jgi:hypothetical protein
MNQAERREFLRANLNVFVNEESPKQHLLARVTDVSERGMRYLLPTTERTGGTVLLEFCLPGDERPIRVRGRVVYDSDDGILQNTAVEFTRIEGQDAGRIRCYVQTRKRAELMETMRRQHLLQ